MVIDFNTIPLEILENFKGGDLHYDAKIIDDGKAKIMLGTLVPGASIGMHQHVGNAEIMYFIEGSGTVIFEDTTLPVEAGKCHYCPEGSSHSLINTSDKPLKFFAVVK